MMDLVIAECELTCMTWISPRAPWYFPATRCEVTHIDKEMALWSQFLQGTGKTCVKGAAILVLPSPTYLLWKHKGLFSPVAPLVTLTKADKLVSYNIVCRREGRLYFQY